MLSSLLHSNQFDVPPCGAIACRKHSESAVGFLVNTGVMRESPPQAQLGLDPSQYLLGRANPLEDTETTYSTQSALVIDDSIDGPGVVAGLHV